MKRIIAFISLLTVIILIFVSCSNIKEIKTYDIVATVEGLYVINNEYIVTLEYAGLLTSYKGELFYNYCMSRNIERMNAQLELTILKTGVIEHKITPIFETKGGH